MPGTLSGLIVRVEQSLKELRLLIASHLLHERVCILLQSLKTAFQRGVKLFGPAGLLPKTLLQSVQTAPPIHCERRAVARVSFVVVVCGCDPTTHLKSRFLQIIYMAPHMVSEEDIRPV